MATLTLTDKNARALYPTAAKEFKTMLEDTFGEKFFSIDITERIDSFELVCAEAGEDPRNYDIPANATPRQRGVILFSILQLICEVFREGVVLDYSNPSQRKYYPWWDYIGSGFSLDDVDSTSANTYVGARLQVDTEKKARHIAKCFGYIYDQYLQWC